MWEEGIQADDDNRGLSKSILIAIFVEIGGFVDLVGLPRDSRRKQGVDGTRRDCEEERHQQPCRYLPER